GADRPRSGSRPPARARRGARGWSGGAWPDRRGGTPRRALSRAGGRDAGGARTVSALQKMMLVLAGVALAACGSGPPQPAPLDPRSEACSSCRMAVSELRFAAQVVAPGELPRFFDDLGCLGTFVKAGRAPEAATAFVAEHRTRNWLRADRAVYTRVASVAT